MHLNFLLFFSFLSFSFLAIRIPTAQVTVDANMLYVFDTPFDSVQMSILYKINDLDIFINDSIGIKQLN